MLFTVTELEDSFEMNGNTLPETLCPGLESLLRRLNPLSFGRTEEGNQSASFGCSIYSHGECREAIPRDRHLENSIVPEKHSEEENIPFEAVSHFHMS